MTIVLIGAAAALSIAAYRRTTGNGGDASIAGIRQSTSVILAIADAVWAVLDALVFLTRPRGGGAQPLRRGIQVASDVAE